MKNFKTHILSFCVGLLFFACSEDKGNYDYTDINEVKVANFEKMYTASFGDNFALTPEISGTIDLKDETNYTYRWYAINPIANSDIQGIEFAKTRNLNGPMTLKPALYDMYFSIKDNKTGVTWTQKFKLNVISDISKGWLVLSDDVSTPRLDFVTDNLNQTPKVLIDVLGKTGSALKLSGKAIDVEAFDTPMYSPGPDNITYGVYVSTTDQGTNKIHQVDFAWKPTYALAYEVIGLQAADNYAAEKMLGAPAGSTGASMYVKDNDVRYFMKMYAVNYASPINYLADETAYFKASPFVSFRGGFNTDLLFDVEKRRFLKHASGAMVCTKFGTFVPSTSRLFDENNVNKDLVYMETSRFNSRETFAILKDIGQNNFYLARFSSSYLHRYFELMQNAPDLHLAKNFAVDPLTGYVFYTVGGKLYEYDFGTRSAKLMLDKGANEITYIGYNEFCSTADKNKLIVASFDGSQGKMEFYTVPPVNGDLVLDKSFSGFGKIKKIAYKAK